MVVITFKVLLAVKKPAKIFDVAVVGCGALCDEHNVARAYVFTLHLAYIEDSCFFCFIVIAKNIDCKVVLLFNFRYFIERCWE